MEPIFDRARVLQAWFLDRSSIFGPDMKWIAFVERNSVFTAEEQIWLGQLFEQSLTDRKGKAVLWIPGSAVRSVLHPQQPMRPKKPIRPKRPIYPVRPLLPNQPSEPNGGWSPLSFEGWLMQR